MSAPMNRDGKEATKIIAESTEIAKTMALMIFGFGRTMTLLTLKPKSAAAHAMQASDQLKVLADQVFALAERIVDWDEKKLVVPGKAIVDVNHNPL